MTPTELARNRQTARNLLSDLHRQYTDLRSNANMSSDEAHTRLRIVAQDADIFLDLARTWMDESLDKAAAAYQAAVAISAENAHDVGDDEVVDADADAEGGAKGVVSVREIKMSSNLGALYQLQGDLETAQRMYQDALSKVAGEKGQEAENVKTVLAFNLGRAYEEEGDVGKGSQWYRDVLRQHPEHMECESVHSSLRVPDQNRVHFHKFTSKSSHTNTFNSQSTPRVHRRVPRTQR